MLDKIEFLIHIFISVFNVFPLMYYPLRYKLNIKKEKIYILFVFLGFMTVLLFLNLYTNMNFEKEYTQYLKLLFNAVYIILIYCLVKKDFYKVLFIFLMQTQYSTFIFGNTYIIINLLKLIYPNIHHMHLLGSLLMMFQVIIMYPIISKFINNKVIPTLCVDDDEICKDHCFIQIILIFFEFIISTEVDLNFNSIVTFIITRCCIFAIYYYLFSTLFKTSSEINYKSKLEKETLYISNQLNLQREQYASLNKHIKEVKAAKHDLRHHIKLIEAYLINKDTERLEEYIKEYKLTLPPDIEICYEEKFALNALFHNYIKIAKSYNIDIDIKFDLNNKIAIQDTDLCVIFGNCIENAIEACLKLDTNNRNINLRTKLFNDIFIITIDNTFDGIVKMDGDIYLSSKRYYNTKGIGITSVKEIVKKYNGYVKFQPTDKEFKVSIMMKQNCTL